RPGLARSVSTLSATRPSSPTSPAAKRTDPPPPAVAGSPASAAAAAWPVSASRPGNTTWAPSAAKAATIARPIPREPPVTIATRPESLLTCRCPPPLGSPARAEQPLDSALEDSPVGIDAGHGPDPAEGDEAHIRLEDLVGGEGPMATF